MAWLTGGWAKRVKLTLSSAQIDAALSDFPVPIYLSAASGIGDADVSAYFDELASDSNRKKIAVTTSDGTTQCQVEIERHDHASGKAWLHVKVPSVAADADTDIYLYYDSTHADNTTYVGDTAEVVARNVWDANFKGVYHLSSATITDATGQNNGTQSGIDASNIVDGLRGKALSIATNERIGITGSVASDPDQLTVEALFKANSAGVVFAHRNETTRLIQLWAQANNELRWQMRGSGNSIQYVTYNGDLTGWTYAAGKFDTINDAHSLTVNAGSPITSSYDFTTETFTSAVTLLGAYSLGTGHDGYLTGVLDEVRISDIPRSAAWLKATYYGLFDSLITFGVEETPAEALEMPVGLLVLLDVNPALPAWSLSGVVLEAGSPIARTVRVYKRSDGSLIDETTSAAGDGSFSFTDLPTEPVYVVALDDTGGEAYNALIFDRVLPKQVLN